MRVFFVILMMAWLPLRAGLGDVMALERTRSDTPPALHQGAMHDCHETRQHAAAGPMDHHAPVDGTQADHACSDCTVCHVTALPGVLSPRVPALAGNAPPQARVVTPVSVDPVPGLKPPIA